MNSLVKTYRLDDLFVDDLLDDTTQVIFVLESPHTQEVKQGYPVAGKSGKDMSKILLDNESYKLQPFGKLISEKKLPLFGILNVSNIPLQASAYIIQEDELFREFALIRQNPLLRKKESHLNDTIRIIQADFKNRLMKHKDKKLVLCGCFVQKLFNTLFLHTDFKDTIEVPHPSFNNWSKQKYEKKVVELLEFCK